MEKQRSTSSRNNGILVMGFTLTSILFFNSVQCHSFPYLPIILESRPGLPILSVNNIPLQDANLEIDFNVDLKKFIHAPHPQIVYRIYGHNSGSYPCLGYAIKSESLPYGVTHENIGPAKCFCGMPAMCYERFDVDPYKFTMPLSKYEIPVVMIKYPVNNVLRKTPTGVNNSLLELLPDGMMPIVIKVDPQCIDGLCYDNKTYSIKGKPTHPGIYQFKVSATNGISTTQQQTLQIKVGVNPKDKPMFKLEPLIPIATPGKEYRLNMMDLLEPNKSFMISNQINFSISSNYVAPDWLSIDETNPTVLHGTPKTKDAGLLESITLIAASNTGGDSEPKTLQIQVAQDPAMRPRIEKGIELFSSIGESMYIDLKSKITDPSLDTNLQLIITNVSPKASWLSISSDNLTAIIGTVPPEALGKTYSITLAASNMVGGSSDEEVIPLKIDLDKDKTPGFYASHPNFEYLYEGQYFEHDFVGHKDITPEYDSFPYVIEFADKEKYTNPDWMHIENNKLIADQVPENLPQNIPIFITIKNKPGGQSEVYSFDLFVIKPNLEPKL